MDTHAIEWAVARWHAEVGHRPLVNVHRRSLDDTWRQVIRHFGGDPFSLIGPAHDELLAALEPGERAAMFADGPSESALDLALRFHAVYERLAPAYGYETRPDTRAFDAGSKNGRLMIAVCEELLGQWRDAQGGGS
jgi:hypothetical protein